MELFTIQVAKWRLLKDSGIEFMDTTVKSNPYGLFSPTWEIVLGVKSGQISEEEYSKAYKRLILERWKDRDLRLEFFEFLDKPRVAIACFCPPGKFCHRVLLVELLRDLHIFLNRPFQYSGEIKDKQTLLNLESINE